MTEKNQVTFETRDVVGFYAGSTALQKPEATILRVLANELPRMRMIDVGVGGGRTTRHVAQGVREYVGIDYSSSMVDVCRKGFPRLRFEVCDMRDMRMFADASFDFVLISFNGIDYVSEEGRRQTFAEIRRIAAPDGYFCFSTHNLLSTPYLFRFPRAGGLFGTIEASIKQVRLRLNNEPIEKIMMRDCAVINDGSYRFRARTYYVRPKAQIAELENAGFKDTRVYSLETGQEVEASQLDTIADPWLYYLSRA